MLLFFFSFCFCFCIWWYRVREPFTQSSVRDFLELQRTIHPHTIFEIDKLKNQVTQNQLDDYLKTQHWQWSQPTIKRYMYAQSMNPYVQTDPYSSLQYVQSVYNENAINMVLDMQRIPYM